MKEETGFDVSGSYKSPIAGTDRDVFSMLFCKKKGSVKAFKSNDQAVFGSEVHGINSVSRIMHGHMVVLLPHVGRGPPPFYIPDCMPRRIGRSFGCG